MSELVNGVGGGRPAERLLAGARVATSAGPVPVAPATSDPAPLARPREAEAAAATAAAHTRQPVLRRLEPVPYRRVSFDKATRGYAVYASASESAAEKAAVPAPVALIETAV